MSNNLDNLISIVMPVYNAEKYLDEAIQSILNQTFINFEFIIINDGSSDNSLKIIEKYKKLDDRIILISRENKGLVVSLNEGIENAKGKYIARMDADDISLEKRFQMQIELMEKDNLDICGGYYLSIKEDASLNSLHLTPRTHNMCMLSLVSKVPFAHPSVMIRKSFLNKNDLKYGQSQYKIAEDLDLWVRMAYKGAKFGNVNDLIMKYRILDNSLSKVNRVNIKKDTKKILNSFFRYNYSDNLNILKQVASELNEEEKALIVRMVYKIFSKKINFSVLKYLKPINNKIIICSILSELFNA